MPRARAQRKETKSEDAILDQATEQLLAAVKSKLAKEGKTLDRERLRKEGYSERFLHKVEEA